MFGHSLVVCNNQQFKARRGEIATPEYPKNYPKNSRCDWTIEVEEGYQITLSFTQVSFVRDFFLFWNKLNMVNYFMMGKVMLVNLRWRISLNIYFGSVRIVLFEVISLPKFC